MHDGKFEQIYFIFRLFETQQIHLKSRGLLSMSWFVDSLKHFSKRETKTKLVLRGKQAMNISFLRYQAFDTTRPRQNGRHFTDDIFKWIFVNENVWNFIEISLKFVPRCPINNILMMVRLPTHICVPRPQCVHRDIFKCNFLERNICNSFKFRCSILLGIELTIIHHWLWEWLRRADANVAFAPPSRRHWCQRWQSSLTHEYASPGPMSYPRTKWPSFRRHFRMHIHEWKVLYFDSNFT